MNDILLNIISALCTCVIIPLITWGGTELIKLIEAKTKNEKATEYLSLAVNIVTNAVKVVFQTYVDGLKKAGKFDKEAQAAAFAQAKGIVLSQIGDDQRSYIANTYGDFNGWVDVQIESTIDTLKN